MIYAIWSNNQVFRHQEMPSAEAAVAFLEEQSSTDELYPVAVLDLGRKVIYLWADEYVVARLLNDVLRALAPAVPLEMKSWRRWEDAATEA